MVSNKLSDSRMEFLSGSIVIEADGSGAEQGEDVVTILYKGTETHLRKAGIYRFDSEPAQLRVYSGEAEVVSATNQLIARSGKMVALDTAMTVEKFETKDTDALSRWSKRRAEGISMANLSSAKNVSDSGLGWTRGGWFYNPYFGMVTFIPGRGIYRSPYGYEFYSPFTVYRVYRPPVERSAPSFASASSGGFGSPNYSTVQQTSAGYSGVIASAPVAAASRPAAVAASAPAAQAAAPVARDSGRVGGGR
jgi:hypothetical protein